MSGIRVVFEGGTVLKCFHDGEDGEFVAFLTPGTTPWELIAAAVAAHEAVHGCASRYGTCVCGHGETSHRAQETRRAYRGACSHMDDRGACPCARYIPAGSKP